MPLHLLEAPKAAEEMPLASREDCGSIEGTCDWS
jgi:hypothetical protein